MAHNPTEHVQEEIHHQASHGQGGRWITAAATTAAILAAFAAVAGALATSHLTQSTLIRIKANDNWNYYQAKSIKSSLLDAKIYSAQLSKVEPRKSDLDKKTEYATQMSEIQSTARDLEHLAKEHLETHETYEKSATLFHIAIAIVAISVVARRKTFWYFSILGGAIGVILFSGAILHAPPHLKEEPAETSRSAPAHGSPAATEPNTSEKTSEHSAEPSTAAK